MYYKLVECASSERTKKPHCWGHGFFRSISEATHMGKFENYGKRLTPNQYKEFLAGKLNIDDLYNGGGPATAFAVVPVRRATLKLGFVP